MSAQWPHRAYFENPSPFLYVTQNFDLPAETFTQNHERTCTNPTRDYLLQTMQGELEWKCSLTSGNVAQADCRLACGLLGFDEGTGLSAQ